jgi:hypothetical protein
MPKGLHALDDVPYGPDEVRIAEHLALIPEHGSGSFFKDVNRVEPGHFVIVTPSGETAKRHWEPRRDTLKLASADDYAEALRHHLDRAVEARLRGAGARSRPISAPAWTAPRWRRRRRGCWRRPAARWWRSPRFPARAMSAPRDICGTKARSPRRPRRFIRTWNMCWCVRTAAGSWTGSTAISS